MVVKLKDEYYTNEVHVPVGNYLWWGADRLESRDVDGEYQVLLYGRWLKTSEDYFEKTGHGNTRKDTSS